MVPALIDKPYANADFIDLYLDVCGETSVPKAFHEWCAVSLLAALMQNRVKVVLSEILGGMTLEHFIVLIGESGSGKGNAVKMAMRLLKDAFVKEETPLGEYVFHNDVCQRQYEGMNVYAGTLTRASIQDLLDTQKNPETGVVGHAKLYWIAEELSLCFGSRVIAEDSIRLLVGFKGEQPVPQQARVRHGRVSLVIKDPCINLLGASTWKWLGNVVTGKEAAAGMLRRTRFIEVDYNIKNQSLREKPAVDWQRKRETLLERVRVYAMTSFNNGLVTWSKDGGHAFHRWFESGLLDQNIPDEPSQRTLHGCRASEVAKLAAISAISRYDHRVAETWPEITVVDVERAKRWWGMAMETAPRMTVETSDDVRVQHAELVARVAALMCNHTKGKRVHERMLAKVLGQQGMVKRSILEAIETVEHRGWCQREFEVVDGKVETWLKWLGKE